MAGTPIIPGRPANPVGQVQRVRKAARAWAVHLDALRHWLNELIDRIPVRVVNDARYDYQIDLGALREVVREILVRMGNGPSESVLDQVMAAYEEGTGLSVINLSKITDSYTRSVTHVLSSHQYMRRSALIRARVLEEMKGFAGESGQELSRILSEAVENGLNPRALKDRLADRFGMSKARAERIARTEIAGALRRGRLDEAQDAEENLGINTGMLWISALSPTTRASHAARHAHIYSTQEVREFYARDGNGINCKCGQTEILLNDDGSPMTPAVVARLTRRKSTASN